jgi:3-hydroxyisobutyrate dehydrogenase-like beta-hydroxyacid dehydrogenase
VAFGELRPAIGEPTVYVDSSTVSPTLSGELAAAFPRFVALPVIGNPVAVRSGQAVFLAGGDGAVLEMIEPLLGSLSSSVRRYGTAPLALAAKLTNNLLLLSEVVALAESLAVGHSGGLSDEQLRELLGDHNPLLPPGLRNRFEGMLTGSQESWWSTVLGAKDAGLAVAVAGEAGVDLPLGKMVRRLYDRAAGAGRHDADIAAVTELYRAAVRA